MKIQLIHSVPGETLPNFLQRCRELAEQIQDSGESEQRLKALAHMQEQARQQTGQLPDEVENNSAQKFRVLRVLEYTGPMSAITRTMRLNAVQGEQQFGELTIREAVLGGSAEALNRKYDGQNLRETVYELTKVFRGMVMPWEKEELLRQCFEQIYREINKLEKL